MINLNFGAVIKNIVAQMITDFYWLIATKKKEKNQKLKIKKLKVTVKK